MTSFCRFISNDSLLARYWDVFGQSGRTSFYAENEDAVRRSWVDLPWDCPHGLNPHLSPGWTFVNVFFGSCAPNHSLWTGPSSHSVDFRTARCT
jgi:hypothetical protein